MTRPSRRTGAYLILWVILGVIVGFRRAPEVPVTVERGPGETAPFRLDVNQVPWQHLTLIEGIGETLARRIVAVREERGGFESLEQVKAVPGVPDRCVDEAASYLELGTPPRGPEPSPSGESGREP